MQRYPLHVLYSDKSKTRACKRNTAVEIETRISYVTYLRTEYRTELSRACRAPLEMKFFLFLQG